MFTVSSAPVVFTARNPASLLVPAVTEQNYQWAVRFAVQQLHAPRRKESQRSRKTAGIAASCDSVQAVATPEIGPEGFEPPTKGL